MNNKGILLVVSGPSGAGKGTICANYLKKHKNDCVLSVSATTRSMRKGEKEGESYYFITEDEFKKRVADDGFLEHAVFCGNMYGTPKKDVMELIERGIDVILEIEVQGAMQVRSNYPEGVFVFVLPPSMGKLKERLKGRNTESDDVRKKRLDRAKEEFKFIEKYNYVLINDNLEDAVGKLEAIIKAEKCFMPRNYDFVKKEFLERN